MPKNKNDTSYDIISFKSNLCLDHLDLSIDPISHNDFEVDKTKEYMMGDSFNLNKTPRDNT